MGSIVFVHGTGVRLASYRSGFALAKRCAADAGLQTQWVDCAWGDPLGVQFGGRSLPDPPSAQQLEEQAEDMARWSWLFADPLAELEKLTIRDPSVEDAGFGAEPEWLTLWNQIEAYQPGLDLRALLARAGLVAAWPVAWQAIVQGSPITRQAFETSPHELPEAASALARALVAKLHGLALQAGQAGPSRSLRDSLVERLRIDWGVEVLAPSDFFIGMLKRAGTALMRRNRNDLSDTALPVIGDILLYQSRGADIRDFIRSKIAEAAALAGPVTVVAHSLGGIACVDLLALPNPPAVARLVTAGSQSPLFYELDALHSLRLGQGLPPGFPSWLNFYDRNDVLSYVAGRLFGGGTTSVDDVPVESGQPFPDSHSAYFGNDAVWSRIKAFIGQP